MTTAPPNLLAVRTLLSAHLPVGGDALGVVGDTAHVSSGDSYHLGRPEQRTSGYSVSESPRDRAGLCSYASALDVGWWSAHGHDLRHMSAWLVAQCRAGAPDTRDIREIIYSLDGRTVRRWDRLGRRTSGDSSHRFHTHVSYFRDATKAGRDQRPLYLRYLQSIGLIPQEAPDMDQRDKMVEPTAYPDRSLGQHFADIQNLRDALYARPGDKIKPTNPPPPGSVAAELFALPGKVDALAAKLDATPPGSVVISDEQLARVIRGVLREGVDGTAQG